MIRSALREGATFLSLAVVYSVVQCDSLIDFIFIYSGVGTGQQQQASYIQSQTQLRQYQNNILILIRIHQSANEATCLVFTLLDRVLMTINKGGKGIFFG